MSVLLVLYQICGGEKPYVSPDVLRDRDDACREEALSQFDRAKKMGGVEFSRQYREELEKDINQMFIAFCKHNEGKNIFTAFRTPAVLLALVAALYMASGITGFVGLSLVAQLFNCAMGLLLIALLTWGYIKYSGQCRDLGKVIDTSADYVLDQVIQYSSLCFKRLNKKVNIA